jgi:hypothetical protein
MIDNEDVVSFIQLAPDAGLVKSLGANHTLESAIADLVDNSLDARATRVVIRLLTENDRLAQVEVIDNGKGMDSQDINSAMTIGHRREYGVNDLGHFGMGLKAASFGHCDVLTVWSQREGSAPVGRRIRRADFSKDFTCEILSDQAAEAHALERETVIGSSVGTSIVWTHVRNVYRGKSAIEARAWLTVRNESLRAHLGVTFHRLLSDGRLELAILIDEINEATGIPAVPVLPIDPFGYATSGHPSYPKVLVAKAGEAVTRLTCHIWPAKSDVTGFRIGTKSGEKFQGFYIYRNDRLLQVGGWSHIANRATSRQLARVVLEDSSAIGPFLTMNPEKSGLKFEPAFHDAVSRARAEDGTTFDEFLEDAESTYTIANKRSHRRQPVIRPEKGFAPSVRRQIGRELDFLSGGESVDVKWRRMPDGEFLDVDLADMTLWLNSRYRHLFAPMGGSLNDAPVLKALLFLLTHHVFEGQHLGSRDKDDIALWRSVLGAAVLAEEDMRES